MKVITSNPILVNSKRVEPNDMYLNAGGPTAAQIAAAQGRGTTTTGGPSKGKGGTPVGSQPSAQLIEAKRKEGKTWDATKRMWVRVQDSGLLSSIKNIFGGQPQVTNDTPYYDPSLDTNTKQPMTTGTKVIIGVAIVAVVVGAVFLLKPAKAGK